MGEFWQFVIGITVAVVGISVVPWLTALANDWIEQRRGDRRHVRELYEELRRAQEMDLNGSSGLPNATGDEGQAVMARHNAMRAVLWAQLSPRDQVIRDAAGFALTNRSTPDQERIVRWWAFGYRRAARRIARRMLNESGTR